MKGNPNEGELKIESSLVQKQLPLNNLTPTFCVALLKNGTTAKAEGRVEEFLEVIKDADFAWINLQVSDFEAEGGKIAATLGFNPAIVHELAAQRFSGYDDHITELGLMLPAVHVSQLQVDINKLMILLKDNLIVTIHGESITRFVKFARYAVTFFKKVPKNLDTIDKLSLVLIRLLDENNERNFDGIRSIQEQGEEISKYLIEPTFPKQELGKDIYRMKHALISYLEALWASLDVIHYLRYGDAELITDDAAILQKISLLSSDLTRQISISEQMSSVLASGLEVLQSIYNNQLTILNNRISVLAMWIAIVGAAFIVPNTIATIFGTPIGEHFEWRIQLLIIIFSTVFSIIGVYWFIKKRGIMSQKID